MPFDADALLAKPVSSAMSTERIVVPEGEYTALTSPDPSKLTLSSGEKQDGNVWVAMDIPWEIDDPEVARETGRPKSTCYQRLFLDIDGNGELDTGRGMNADLGSLREAVSQHTDQPWSMPELCGQAAKITIKHDIYQGVTHAKVMKVDRL